jgi:hypothetical protein
VIFCSEAFPFAKVGMPFLVLSKTDMNAHLQQGADHPIAAVVPIRYDNIAWLQMAKELLEQGQFTRLFAFVTPYCRANDDSGGQADHGDGARDRKTDTRLLSSVLRVCLLILDRIGHLERKAVYEKRAKAAPFPFRICLRFGT